MMRNFRPRKYIAPVLMYGKWQPEGWQRFVVGLNLLANHVLPVAWLRRLDGRKRLERKRAEMKRILERYLAQ